MDHETPQPHRRYYGIAEIADALGVDRQLVTVWRRRSSHGLPDPDEELASGPLWEGALVEPWIAATRTRLDQERAAKIGDGLTPQLARRAARRLFRLVALLLEERPRQQPLEQALQDLAQLHAPLARVTGAPEGSRRSLQDLTALCALAEQALASRRPTESMRKELLVSCLLGVPQATRLVVRLTEPLA